MICEKHGGQQSQARILAIETIMIGIENELIEVEKSKKISSSNS